MWGLLFMAGTFVIEGGLVLVLMYLFTRGEREAREREAARVRKEMAAAAPSEVRKAA